MRTLIATLALFASTSAFAYDVDHVVEAMSWVNAIDAANNSYGDPATITWSGAEPTVVAKCGSAQGLIFKNTYTDITDAVLIGLTGEASPHAINWFDAIDDAAVSGDYALDEVTGDELDEGDLLVTAYGQAGTVDHAMLVARVTDVTGLTDSIGKAYKAGPTGTTHTLLVGVVDASETPHGPDPANARALTDTRYIHPDASGAADKGLGYGEILVYTNAAGDIVGWRWSVISSTLHIVSGTAGSGQSLRPLIAGRMSGPQIGL